MARERAQRLRAERELNDSFRAVSLLLDKGATVRRVAVRATASRRAISSCRRAGGVVAEVAKQTGVDFAALPVAVPAGAYAIRKPRIAMYQRYGGGNMDEGWTRLMFEQFDIPVKAIMDAEIKKGDLTRATTR